jgi:hypothetical protein
VEAAQRVLGRHVAFRPAGNLLGSFDGHERKPHAVGVAQRQYGLAQPLLRRLMGDAALDQALRPIAKRPFRDDEGRFHGHPVTVPAGRQAGPGKKGQRRARAAGFVAIVEMPRRGIVEIDGLLDQSQAEVVRVEGDVPFWIAANCRDVVNSRARGHDRPRLSRTAAVRMATRYVGITSFGTIPCERSGFFGLCPNFAIGVSSAGPAALRQ